MNNYYEITENFYELTRKGDLILNMGAGDCHNFWSILNEKTIKLGRLLIQQKNNNECHKSRLIALFQPHRYSRVKQFTKEFAEELSKADVIYVTSIYGAGEGNEDKITSKIITDLIYKKNKNVSYINNYYEVTKNFYKLTQKGDLILNMGAGDCHNLWSILNKK